MSAIHEEAGDHHEGIAVLQPVYEQLRRRLERPDLVRLLRRLGVHCHRAGRAPEALARFAEAKRIADPARDADEIVAIESELAELHTLRGEYALAEEACRRGLSFFTRSPPAPANQRRPAAAQAASRRMEVTLRASLGHLELRRLRLDRAREELSAALALASGSTTTGMRALILNNLGIVHAQLNEFSSAERCFSRAQRLLRLSGERREMVQVACNRALIAAKTGDAHGAQSHMERAAQILRFYPDERLEFFAENTRGTVSCFLGDMASAIEAFERALPIGRRLGDVHLAGYGDVFLAEACLACGRHADALRRLRAAAKDAQDGPPLLSRMVHARLLVAESLVGQPRAAAACLGRLRDVPRTNVLLLEAWNDLFVALASSLTPDEEGSGGGSSRTQLLRAALETSSSLGTPAGRGFAQVGLLYEALRGGDAAEVRGALSAMDSADVQFHRYLAVLDPLARAEASLQLGDLDGARGHLAAAGSAIVGHPFLELDWRLEYLRSSLAERQGDREGAKTCLHRSVHRRDLVARLAPARLRERFLAHPRFAPLAELARRLEGPRIAVTRGGQSTEPCSRLGLVARSAAMARVLKLIGDLASSDVPVVICGETGTGKDLVARAIHESSRRSAGPFHALHCASLPSELFESELFGHEAGAFTGADQPHEGLLAHFAGGTLLLDEVTSLSPLLQAKLLRVLDSRKARPLGGVEERPIDVRFLASSSADLAAAARTGALRPGLYFRLRGAEVLLPPLRARREDIPLLARQLLGEHERRLGRTPPPLTSDAMEILEQHDWPGNVRELENFLVRILVTTSARAAVSGEAVRGLLPHRQRPQLFGEGVLASMDLKDLKRELEREYLTQLFRETAGDIDAMAARLGVKRVSLYIWLRRIGIDIRTLRGDL
jgi:DNA-binding NtrC family response regulator/tetratricopeptide (TPR) repeat protein